MSYREVLELCRSGFFTFSPTDTSKHFSLSVIIATTGRHTETLKSTIEWLKVFEPRPELIVVLDGAQSPNERRTIIDLVEAFGGICEENATRRGASNARNLGAARARGELLLFLDDDVKPPAEGLRRLLSYFDLANIVAVAPRVIQVGSSPYDSSAFPLDMGPQWSYVSPRSTVRYVPTALLITKKEAFVNAHGFDENLKVGEDVDLIWRLGVDGDILYDPTVIATHNRITSTTEKFLRSYRYGLSYTPLHDRFPEYIRTKPRTLFDWLALILPPLGRSGIALASLLPALKPALSRELRNHFGIRVQVELVAQIIRRVFRSCTERWSHALIVPLGVLALTSSKARRSLNAIVITQTVEILVQSQGEVREVAEYFVGALGYSCGYCRSLLGQCRPNRKVPNGRARHDQSSD